MIKSVICDELGLSYPVFQGGMAHIADGRLAAAVSEAGGLGLIAAAGQNAAAVKEQIDVARSLTARPIGVNIMLMSPFIDEVARLVIEEKIEVVTTGAGNPQRFMDAWNEAGLRVIPVVASVAMARLAERSGAFAVIAEGTESGGHVGETSTLVLVPQVCDRVSIPVLAAGGIGDGRGVAAAFMLGACGVQLGTRFLVARECGVHPVYKQKILKATDISTVVTGKRLGHPVRSLKTPFTRDYQKAELNHMPDEELEALGIGSLRRAAKEGDSRRGSFLAGQIAGMITREQTAGEMIEEIFREAEQALQGAGRFLAQDR